MSRDTDPQAKRTFRKTMPVLAVADVSSRNKRQTTEAYEDVAILPGYNISTTTTNGASSKNHFDTDLHGNVNIFLAGAMLSGVIVVVALMCYCCHKNIRKSRPQEYSQYWRTEPDVHSLEVFSTEAHIACCDRQSTIDGTRDESTYGAPSSCPVTPSSGPGPPPTYDSLIFDPRSLPASIDKKYNGPDGPEAIIPSVMSTLLGLAAIPARPARPAATNEPAERETATVDEGLPSYEAALKLDANGYV